MIPQAQGQGSRRAGEGQARGGQAQRGARLLEADRRQAVPSLTGHDRPRGHATSLAPAHRDEASLLGANPALGLELPGEGDRPDADYIEGDESEGEVKAFSREQLATVLAVVNPRHRLLLEILADTGLRISEAIALEWRHVELDGSRPHVKVRRAIVRGKVGAPKSKHGKREVRLPLSLVRKLRAAKLERGAQPGDLVFPSETGTPLAPGNLRRRTLRVTLVEAGASWAGFHTFRHTFPTMQIARGCNIVALSRAMGHHSGAFTLSVYGHLLEGDEAPALDARRGGLRLERGGNMPHRTLTHEYGALEANLAA